MTLQLKGCFSLRKTDIDVQFFSFPGGERHVRISPPEWTPSKWEITAHLYSPSDIIDLMLLRDAICRMNPNPNIVLRMPYVPYGRQDRVAVHGEPLSIAVFCNLINSMNFNAVEICDPHSDVTPALLNNVRIIPLQTLITDAVPEDVLATTMLVAPDAGARKRVEKLAMELGGRHVIYAGKRRDVVTGKLSGFYIEGEVPQDAPLLVVDDLCDGGYTFVGLANILHQHTKQKIYLYVTHGLFTKGVELLYDAGYSGVYSANVRNPEAKFTMDDWNQVR